MSGSPYPIFHSNDVVHIVLSLWASKNVSLNKSNDCTSCCLAGQKELNSNFYCLRHTISIKDCAITTVGMVKSPYILFINLHAFFPPLCLLWAAKTRRRMIFNTLVCLISMYLCLCNALIQSVLLHLSKCHHICLICICSL